MARIRLALIYGGMSGEHSVSLITAASVLRNLDRSRYEVIPVGIRTDGTWIAGTDDPDELEAIGFAGELPPSRTHLMLGMGNRTLYEVAADGSGEAREYAQIDVAFPVLHGPFGEDGTIQGMCEMAQIPYVGCGVLASAAGMDKHMMKLVLDAANIAYAPYVLVSKQRWDSDRDGVYRDVEERLTYPVFVKPARAGSSIGVSRVENADALRAAIELAQSVDPKVLVETGINAREIECAVLGSPRYERPRAARLGEILLGESDAGFYDYSNKYLDGAELTLSIPADIDPSLSEKIRDTAIAVFEAFGCEGLTRVDFFVLDDDSVMVNELNTMPGFTAVSMYPKMWEAAGMSYSELLDELISLALERPLGIR